MYPYCTPNEKGSQLKKLKPFLLLVRLAGFEPATYGFVVRHSIQLSYRRIVLSVLLYPKFFQSTSTNFCDHSLRFSHLHYFNSNHSFSPVAPIGLQPFFVYDAVERTQKVRASNLKSLDSRRHRLLVFCLILQPMRNLFLGLQRKRLGFTGQHISRYADSSILSL